MKLKYIFINFFILYVLFGFLSAQKIYAETTSTNEKVYILNAHCYPNPFHNDNEITKIKFKVKAYVNLGDASIAVVIYDYNGKKVWTKRSTHAIVQGDNIFEVLWGGENDLGEKVANGLYYGKIIVEVSNTKISVIKILVK